MNITYRILQPADAPAYRQLRLEALKLHPANFGSTYEDESNKPRLAFETYIQQQVPGKFIAGAFDDDTLIGICGFVREDAKKTHHRGSIIQMYVRQQYSGRGCGLALLQATVQHAFILPGVEQLVLGVVTANISAVKTYEKAGFKTIGVWPGYFKEADGNYLDEQLMILNRGSNNTILQNWFRQSYR